jgi:acid stress-induced BolA-like protein IbaG/YrbA
MITNSELKHQLLQNEQIKFVQVEGDGYHYHLTVVSDVFLGKKPIARQQWVYAQIKGLIVSGAVHALSMKTFTNEEWEKQNG